MTAIDGAHRARPPIDLSDYGEWDALVVRTDYADGAAWQRLAAALRHPADGEFDCSCYFVDDPAWDGASVDDVLAALPPEPPSVVFIADAAAMRREDALLAVRTYIPDTDPDYDTDEGVTSQFWLLPGAVGEMHINLAIANMDFEEFSLSAFHDPEKIHRGFL